MRAIAYDSASTVQSCYILVEYLEPQDVESFLRFTVNLVFGPIHGQLRQQIRSV